MTLKRIYVDIDESTEVVIKLMLGKSYLTPKDYQKFFIGLIHNAASGNRR